MGYNSDKEVVFSFIERIDYNDSTEGVETQLFYNFGDYNFGKGDGEILRSKLRQIVNFIHKELKDVFDEDNNTTNN